MANSPKPTLYHAAPSYYSMIARLALIEGRIDFDGVLLDIHRRQEQFEPTYVRLNPNMTVPTLRVGERALFESRDIADHALGAESDETRGWVDLHYGFPIEELTFGWFLSWNILARSGIPRSLQKIGERLRLTADEQPELAELYRRRSEVFARRAQTFDARGVVALYDTRKRTAFELLDRLEARLSDGRGTLVADGYSAADVVWTVFLARIRFIRQGDEIARRPALARYEAAMRSRPSFPAADIWSSLNPLRMARQML